MPIPRPRKDSVVVMGMGLLGLDGRQASADTI
jgi:hypothetical protein